MALREILADLTVRIRGQEGLAQANRGINQAASGLGGVRTALAGAGAALGVSLGVQQIARFTSEVISAGDEIDKTSQSLNLSAEALQRWNFIATRSGVSTQQLSGSLLRLQRTAGAAGDGNRTAQDTFRTLGVEVRDANGEIREGEDLFRSTIIALGEVENSTQRTFLATRLFGRAGAQLLPVVNAGAEGIEELSERFDELGGGLSNEAVAASAAAADALADFEVQMTSVKGELAAVLLPILSRAVDAFGTFTRAVGAMTQNSSALEAVIAVLIGAAIALAIAFAVPALEIVGIAISFALLFLIVEDLITLFRGGESVIGDFIDEMVGDGTAEQWVQNLTDAWNGLILAIETGRALLRGDEAPTASGRATGTAAQARRSAALRGTIRGAQGQSFEEALADANAARAEEGLELFDANGVLPEEAPAAPERARGGRGAPRIPRSVAARAANPSRALGPGAAARASETNIEQNVTNDTTINVEGAGDPEAVAQLVQRRQDRALARQLANAAATLPQAPADA